MDIGGTTAKISVLQNGEPIYRKPSDFFGIPVEISLPHLRSIALGGGSVVKPLAGAGKPDIQLGPESMGSYPGPACYGLGGDQPTLTDAFVTAGLINPDYFLGGSKSIDRELARKAIAELVARPLKFPVRRSVPHHSRSRFRIGCQHDCGRKKGTAAGFVAVTHFLHTAVTGAFSPAASRKKPGLIACNCFRSARYSARSALRFPIFPTCMKLHSAASHFR